MRVGSLRSPREYDDRLPLDVGSYLNLVIPRFEEPRKKITVHVRLLHGRIRKQSSQFLAIQSQNTGKFTSNISKNTSRLTSE